MPQLLFSAMLLLLIVTPVFSTGQPGKVAQLQSPSTQQFYAERNIDLGRDSYRGVQIAAQLSPVPGSSRGEDYLLSVSFFSVKSGKPLEEGEVAVKVTSPDGRTAAPLRLNPVDGVFRTKIRLSRKGESLVKIGSKLADEKKRIFRFFYNPTL